MGEARGGCPPPKSCVAAYTLSSARTLHARLRVFAKTPATRRLQRPVWPWTLLAANLALHQATLLLEGGTQLAAMRLETGMLRGRRLALDGNVARPRARTAPWGARRRVVRLPKTGRACVYCAYAARSMQRQACPPPPPPAATPHAEWFALLQRCGSLSHVEWLVLLEQHDFRSTPAVPGHRLASRCTPRGFLAWLPTCYPARGRGRKCRHLCVL